MAWLNWVLVLAGIVLLDVILRRTRLSGARYHDDGEAASAEGQVTAHEHDKGGKHRYGGHGGC